MSGKLYLFTWMALLLICSGPLSAGGAVWVAGQDNPVFAAAQEEDTAESLKIFAIIVHLENPITSLSSERLRRIFRAEQSEWDSREKVALLLPRTGRPEKTILLDRVYHLTSNQLKKHWIQLIYQNRLVEPPRTVQSPGVALRLVERIRGAISIVPVAAINSGARVKIISIDGLLPGDLGYALSQGRNPIHGLRRGGFDYHLVCGKPLAGLTRTWPLAQPAFVGFGLGTDPTADVPRPMYAVLTEQTSPASDEDPLAHYEDQSGLDDMFAADGGLSDDDSYHLHFQGFAHVAYENEQEIMDDEDTVRNSTFGLETVDFVVTSQLGDRTSMLGEISFEPTNEGTWVVEVERMLLNYHFSDKINLEAGRYLNSLGFWNQHFHHGHWLQTSITRPEVLDFEDDTGMLPLHMSGVRLTGSHYGNAIGARYAVEVGNGRSSVPGITQVKVDLNYHKAVNFYLGLEPAFLPGLHLGGAYYLDKIPENDDPELGAEHGPLDVEILNGHVAYVTKDWEIMAEYFQMNHTDDGVLSESDGWYVQVGYHFGDWTPFARRDALTRVDTEVYWEIPEDGKTSTAGVRYNLNAQTALTVQYEYVDIDMPDDADEPDGCTKTWVAAALFTF
jgi:hypothetical protein